MSVITNFNFTRNNVLFTVNVICHGSADIGDQWELTDSHQDGVTITNPHSDRNSYKFGIPKQYSLAELSRDYAAQGIKNASEMAYQSLQNQLVRDIEAGEYGFIVDAELNGVILLDGYVPGFGFDWSGRDEETLEQAAFDTFMENLSDEVYDEAKKAAAVIVSRSDFLKSLAEE